MTLTGATVLINDLDSVTNGLSLGANAVTGTLDVTSVGSITTSAALAPAATTKVNIVSTNGNITVNNNIGGATTPNTTVNAGNRIVGGAGAIGGTIVNLLATTGIGNSGTSNVVNTDAGTLNLTGPEALVSEASAVTLNAGSVTTLLQVAAAGALTVNQTINVSNSLRLTTSSGNLILSAPTTGTNSYFISSAADIIQNTPATNVIAGGALTLNAFVHTGTLALTTNVASLQTNAGTAGRTLTLNERNGITLLGQNVSTLTINASQNTAGAIVIGTPFTVATTTLTNTGSGGGGGITSSAPANIISGTTLTLNSGSGAIDVYTNEGSLTVNSTGNTKISEANSITLNGITAGDFTLTTLAGNSTITYGGNVTATNSVNLFTNNINFGNSAAPGFTTAAPFIFITALGGGFDNLNFTGTGRLNPGSLGYINAANGIVTFGQNTRLNMNGQFVVEGSSAFGSVQLQGGYPTAPFATLNGVGHIDFITGGLLLNGFIDGPPQNPVGTLTWSTVNPNTGGGTIYNTNGDFVLDGDLSFSGTSLTILSSGSIKAANGVSFIDTSNASGSGGNVTLIAGYDFSAPAGDPASSTIPVYGSFTLNAAGNTTGGSILMPNVSVYSSGYSDTGFAAGGTFLAIAHGGSENAGIVSIGNIDTSATGALSSQGGSVTIVGQGGIITGNLYTAGETGGSVTLTGAAPVINGGAGGLTITSGVVVAPQLISSAPLNNANGASIQVNGDITTTGIVYRGGAVSLTADRQIQVGDGYYYYGNIITGGAANVGSLRAGGDVNIRTLGSTIFVTGTIDTSPFLSISAATRGGDAGNISISGDAAQVGSGPSMIAIGGSLLAHGADNYDVGGGGFGGAITLRTDSATVSAQQWGTGAIIVGGFIDSQGGTALEDQAGASGRGGNILVNAGTLVVNSWNYANTGDTCSIMAYGGNEGSVATRGNGGTINITTNALQPLPASLLLTGAGANAQNNVVLPGGMFAVALGDPYNGTAFNVSTNGSGANLSTDYIADANVNSGVPGGFAGQVVLADPVGVPGEPLRITVRGTDVGITENSGTNFSHTIIDPTEGTRNFVSDAQAIALMQTALTQNLGGQSLTVNNARAAGGSFTFDQRDLNARVFSSFNLPQGTTFNITGERPVLAIDQSGVAIQERGNINFTTANAQATIDSAYSNFTLVNGGAINVNSGNLILLGGGSQFLNNGSLTVNGGTGTVIIARTIDDTGLPYQFRTGTTGVTSVGQFGVDLDNMPGLDLKFFSNGTGYTASLGDFPLPSMYNLSSYASTPDRVVNAGIHFQTGGGVNNVRGSLTASTLTVDTQRRAGIDTDLIIGNGVNSNFVTLGDPYSLLADLTVSVNGTLSVADNTKMTAGTLAPGVNWVNGNRFQTLDPSEILTYGTLTLQSTRLGSTAITIGNNSQFQANGGELDVFATRDAIQIGNSNTFRSMGANVRILSSGAVSGGTGNSFQALGTYDPYGSVGGIEISAGRTPTDDNNLLAAFTLPGGTGTSSNVPSLGTQVSVFNLGPANKGVLQRDTGLVPGTVNLSTASAAILRFNRGAMVFDANNGFNVQINGGNWETRSPYPTTQIAYTSTVTPNRSTLDVLDTDDDSVDGSSNDAHDDAVADNSVVRVGEARSNLIVFTDDGQLYTCNIKGVKVRVAGNKGTLVSTDNGLLVVHRGSVCLAPTQTITAHTRFGSVEIPGGSSVALAVSSKSARIGAMASTKPATVFLKNSSQGMQLAAGKALLITTGQVAEQSLYGDDDAAATTATQPAPAANGNMLTGGVSKQVQAAAQPKSHGRVLHIIGSADTRFHTDDDGNLILQHGSMFVEASGNMTVKSSRGAVELKPGALVHIDSRDGLMSVKACSGPGDIKVSRPAFNQALAPGQELLLSAHRPTKNDMTPADGIGRRKQDLKELSDGTHAVISDFAMITLIGNLTTLRKSTSAVDKKIVDRLLRTAAAVGIATSGRGVYTSKPKPKPAFKADATESVKRTPFKPVAYNSES